MMFIRRLFLSIFLCVQWGIGNVLHVPDEYRTIQSGINAAVDDDTVLVAEGRYYENINFRGKQITVASRFIVNSDDAKRMETIIDGSRPFNSDSASVVYFISNEDTNSVLKGFTITGGAGTRTTTSSGAALVGGGIYCHNSGARIEKNIICDNYLYAEKRNVIGGGIAAESADPHAFLIIKDNIISYNTIESADQNAAAAGLSLQINFRLVDNNIYKIKQLDMNMPRRRLWALPLPGIGL